MTALVALWLLVSDPFVVGASAEQSVVVAAPVERVWEYYSNLQNFTRFYPGIVDVHRLDSNTSMWTFEISPPLSSAIRTTYRLTEQKNPDGGVVFRTDAAERDFMECRAIAEPLTSSSTRVTVSLALRMTREHARDFHWLAPIVGAAFISGQMKKQIADDLEKFLQESSNNLTQMPSVRHGE